VSSVTPASIKYCFMLDIPIMGVQMKVFTLIEDGPLTPMMTSLSAIKSALLISLGEPDVVPSRVKFVSPIS